MEQLNNMQELELTEDELKDLLSKDEYPRTFVINEEFTEELEDRFYEWILNLPDYNDGHPDPIHIHISSQGGSVYSLFKMLDLLDRFKGQIYGYANGMAASAGLFLLCACDRREVGRYAELMYHTAQYTVEQQQNISYHMKLAKDIKGMNKKLEGLMKEKTKITDRWLKKNYNKDYWFGRTEAIELGIDNSEEYDEIN